MRWLICIGVLFIIGGIGSIKDNFVVFLIATAVGIIFISAGRNKKKHKKCIKCGKGRMVSYIDEEGYCCDCARARDLARIAQAKRDEEVRITQAKSEGLHLNEVRPRVPKYSSRNTLKFPSVYIVFDIESTGFSRQNDRIIEIAANKYVNGMIVDSFHSYVNPGYPIPIFITQLTGITNKDVENAPAIHEIKKAVLDFFGEDPLVGHNIEAFDIPFLSAHFEVDFNNKLFDTLYLAKEIFPGLPSYKLSFLDKALHLGGLEHHRAENDILITNALFLACASPKKYRPYLEDKETLSKIEIEPRRSCYRNVDIHSILPSDPNAQPNTLLTGKNVVFSGYFSIPLDKAMQIAVDAGATLKSSVSRKVHYLVVGEQDRRFTDENGMTGKLRTATKLIQQGEADIKIIDEKTFFELAQETARSL